MSDVISVYIQCRSCKERYPITARQAHLVAWKAGALIQNVLSYLNTDERELLISQTCSKCFDDMYPIDDEPYCGDCIRPTKECQHGLKQ